MAYMNERGVEILPLYEPIHLRRPSPLPTALKYTEEIWTRIIQVPVEPSIGNRDFARILTYFERFWRRETARRSRDRDSKRAYCD